MIATETSLNQKPAVCSVPVHLTALRLRGVKIEPQETAVTIDAKTKPSRQGLAAQTVSLQGTKGLTGSWISSASPGHGGQQTSNRRQQEEKVYPSSRSPARTVRRAYGRPSSPETEDGESVRKDMSLKSSREDLSDGSTGGDRQGRPLASCTPGTTASSGEGISGR